MRIASGRLPIEEYRSASDSRVDELRARLSTSEERFVASMDGS